MSLDMNRKHNKGNTVWFIILVVFLDAFGTALMISTIPYFSKSLGISHALQGFMGSLYGILQLTGSPMIGKISDVYGRKPVYIISLLGSLISYGSLTYARTPLEFIMTRVPVGLFKHNEASAFAMISDLYEGQEKTTYIGYVGSSIGLGFIVGAAVSGVTMEMDVTFPSKLSTLLFCINIILVILFLPETLTKSTSKNLEVKESNYRWNLIGGPLQSFYIILFGSAFASLLFHSNTVLLLEMVGFSSKQLGYLISLTGLLAVVSGFLLRIIPASEDDYYKLLPWMLGFLCINTMLLAYPSNILFLIAYFLPYIIASNILRSYVMLILSNKSDKERVGVSLSVANSIESFARALTPLIGGFLLNYVGRIAPVWISSCVYGLLFLYCYYRFRCM